MPRYAVKITEALEIYHEVVIVEADDIVQAEDLAIEMTQNVPLNAVASSFVDYPTIEIAEIDA